METIGTYEAKTHFAKLLDRVSKGERIIILRHGVPVAVIAPPDIQPDQIDDAIAQIRELRRGKKLKGLALKNLIEEGRR